MPKRPTSVAHSAARLPQTASTQKGRGFPDLCTRSLIFQLWQQLQLPVYLLCDANPGGLHIALIYRHGSQVYADDNQRLCVPEAIWLGLHPQDAAAYVT